MTNPLYTLGAQGAITPPKSTPFRTLEPEKTHSFEVGFDGEFLQHRLHVNATYYKTNTKNQFFSIKLPWESGYESQYVNRVTCRTRASSSRWAGSRTSATTSPGRPI